MKNINTYYIDFESLQFFIQQNSIKNSPSLLIQVFTSKNDKLFIQTLLQNLTQLLPDAVIIGSTTDGEIMNAEVSTFKTVLSFTQFEHTRLDTAVSRHEEDGFFSGQRLAQTLIKKDTKLLIAFADGLHTNGEAFLQGIHSVDSNIMVAGGLAGDNSEFVQTYVFTKEQIMTRGAVAVAFSSAELSVATGYSFNWRRIGKELTITKAENNRVYTINNKTAVEIYSHYLGEEAAEALPAIGTEFPLILTRNGIKIARAVLVKHNDGSLSFAGNLQVGDKVRFGYGDPLDILAGSTDIFNQINEKPSEAIFIYSCMARRRFMPDDIVQEIRPLSYISPVSGFFTYGEFFTGEKKELLNQSMTVVSLSEKNTVTMPKAIQIPPKKASTTSVHALINLVNVTGRESMEQEAVQQAQHTFEKLFEKSPDGIMLVQNDVFVHCNQKMLDLFGYDSQEPFLKPAPYKLFPVKQPDGSYSLIKLREMRRLAKEKGSHQFEWVHRKENGETFWVDIMLTSMILNNKDTLYMVYRDITQRKQTEEQLDHQRVLMQAILDNAPLWIWMVSTAGKMQFINKTFCDDTGIGEAEFLEAHHYTELLPADVSPGCIRSDQECLTQISDNHISRELIPFTDGKKHLLEISKINLSNVSETDGIIGLAVDITERQQKEEKLQLAASVFTHSREGILITDADNKIIEVNNAFILITGYEREEVLGKNPGFLQSGKHDFKFYADIWKSLWEKNYWSGEICNRRKNGAEYTEMLTISAILDDRGKARNYVALFSDITALKEHQGQLEHIAHYDVLTNLPNRVLFADRLSQAFVNSQGNNVAVAFIDIDGFKKVNDTHGHNMGDDLLVALSRRMKDALREGDTLARVGGDEFLVILLDLKNPEDYRPILERLLLAVSKTVVIDGLDIRVSASIGLSISVADRNAEGDQLIRQADQAMYQAKQSGKNCYHVFDIEQDSAINIQRESLARIKAALDNREFILYYQPKVNMATGEVIGVEALIRWEHPEHGLLLPMEFLPIIEDHTISIELGEWVIDTALSQIETWKAVGLGIPISVNISALQLQQVNFVLRLKELLSAHAAVEPHFLELEVLETSAIGDIAQVSNIMNGCRKLGVQFALDDFGTGYSSLTYLRRLPANLIKIDQVFVRDMLVDPDDLAIIEGVVGLAKAFGRKVIAEGVETIEHGKALLRIGCKLAQGYAISKAMRASDIPEWVASWKPDIMWSEFDPNQNDFNINSEIDHQHWIGALQEYLSGTKDTPPPMDSDKCHFGHWIKNEGAQQYDNHSQFPVLVNLHEHLHSIGRELVDLYNQGNHEEARSREVELLAVYTKQIQKIKEIIMVW